LGLSKRTLQTYRTSGKIPFSMLGGKVYFREADIASLLQTGMSRGQRGESSVGVATINPHRLNR